MSNRLKKCCAVAAVIAALLATGSLAAEDPALLKDLTSTINLLGLPCGVVVSAVVVKEKEHVATCKDGNKYRVYVNAEGRVVAEKQ